jgi:hypothetical protein
MTNKYIERSNDLFHKVLGLFRGYATITYSFPHNRGERIKMENRVKNRDVLYLFTGSLILIGMFKNVSQTYKQNLPDAIQAVNPVIQVESKEPTVKFVEVKNDDRTEKLKSFLISKGSPLADYAGVIIKEADEHGIDWTLTTSISGKESSYGKQCPDGSHNAWGIGGAKAMRRFASWEEGIAYVSALLGNNYKTNMLKGIQTKYCPSFECDKNWVAHVAQFSDAMLATKVGE